MPFLYRPMLKTKAGEATALHHLSVGEKSRLEPVFHVSERPPATFANKLKAAWSGRRTFLDGAFNFNATGAPTDFDAVFNALASGGILVLPVVEIGAPAAYNQAAFARRGQMAPGLMLKCTLASVGATAGLVQQMQLAPNDVDLLIDAGHIAEFDPVSFAGYASHTLQSQIPNLPWRSVTFASSAAPKDFGQLSLGTTIVPRADWIAWSGLTQAPNRPIDFADFGVSHRDLTEPPGIAMAAATVSVRYTIDNNWVTIKGRRTTGATGVPMGNQYRAHAQTLAARPDFGGLPGCWGDARITTIANTPSASAGGRLQWVEINANRHFAFICSRLP